MTPVILTQRSSEVISLLGSSSFGSSGTDLLLLSLATFLFLKYTFADVPKFDPETVTEVSDPTDKRFSEHVNVDLNGEHYEDADDTVQLVRREENEHAIS